jgi:putative DNA-invertase from lambdoid prophage Rac
MMQFIYSRVSTVEQNVKQQSEYLIKQYGNLEVFEDKFSGNTTDREQLNLLRNKLRAGDTIIAYDVSRLARNTEELLMLVRELQEQGIKIVIHTLGGIDITSPTGKMVLTTMASIAEMQRTEMLEKQRIGIDRAKAEGKYKGKQTSQETIGAFNKVNILIAGGMSAAKAIPSIEGIGKAQYYRMKRELKKGG